MNIEFFLLIISLLFFVSILSDKVSSRFGVPSLVLFLLVGMLFGIDGIGISFDNIGLAQAVGSISLSIILFSGGMDTKLVEIKPVVKEGLILSTLGVFLTAAISGISIWLLMKWTHAGVELPLATALLMAATMSSTDSASVFSILRGKQMKLKYNLRPMLELESGSNDPMAAVLTTVLISVAQAGGEPSVWGIIFTIIIQLVLGFLLGFLFGKFLVWLMNKVNIQNESLYPILVLTCCIFIFSVTSFTQGNAFLAVYIGGLVFGNSRFAHKRSTTNFLDGITWLAQLSMFLTLGLLVNPHELIDSNVLILGTIVSVIMILLSRPISVFLCLSPFRALPFKARAFVSWVGLKGASPILFAILCLAADVPNARLIFNVVFLCTLVSLLIQGMSLAQMAQWLGVVDESVFKLRKVQNFDIDLPEEIKSAATEIDITDEMLQDGNQLMSLGLPDKTLAIMVKRSVGTEEHYFVPTGKSEMRVGDKLLVISDNKESLSSLYQDMEDEKAREHSFLNNTVEFIKKYVYIIVDSVRLWKDKMKHTKSKKKQKHNRANRKKSH